MTVESQTRIAASSPIRVKVKLKGEFGHQLLLRLAWLALVVTLVAVLRYGYPFYVLAVVDRAGSAYDPVLRPSGSIGLKLGIAGLAMFVLLFLYPIRKRWIWLSRRGNTRHWLNFHVFLGIAAPAMITLHSSFKLRGIAGMAYWIMMAVSASGFIGRFLYGQIPRSVHATDLSLREIEAEIAHLGEQLERQSVLPAGDLAALMALPARSSVARMGAIGAILRAIALDLGRPFRVGRLRRRFLTPGEKFRTLGGLLASTHAPLEAALSTARTHAWMSARLLFLTRMQQVFHLWHIVHRPFSMAFVVLVALHITVAILFGYYQ